MSRLSLEFIQAFVRAVLRPLIRFCVQRSFTYSEFCKLSKQLYFETGDEYIREHGEAASVSRISALTGLDRRDITRFNREGSFFTRKENLLSRVMGQWEHDARFCRGSGRPRPLSCEGVESEFFNLVQSVSKNLNPYTVLSEMERVGAVSRSNGEVELSTRVYVPRVDVEDGLRILGLDAQDLLSSVQENIIESNETPHLHIRTQYDNLSPQALEKVRMWFLERGEKLHQEVRRFLSKYDKDLNPKVKQGGARAVFTSYSYVERGDETDN